MANPTPGPPPPYLFGGGGNIPPPNVSGNGWYYAFVTTVEDSTEGKGLEIAFELAPKEWMEATFLQPGIDPERWAPPKDIPELLYHIPSISENELNNLLKLPQGSTITEGDWYLIQLVDEDSGVEGDFIDLNQTT